MAKPFSIQAPEEIAKSYAGNKQRIMEAAQMGVVDPTAAILAGMFIDRMRGAQMQEGANPPTVAQEVMGGAPPAPPAPSPSAGGLGAIPQGAPPMAPEAAMPEGMAEGGLVGLSVPDTMFDEPSDGGFAGGGIVAFAKGGMTDEEYIEYIRRKESRGRDYDAKGRPLRNPKSGALYAMQVLPGTAGDPGYGVAPAKAQTPEEYNRVGRDYALALREQFGDVGGAMAYNWGPGNYQKWREAGSPADRVPEETRNYVAEMGGLGALSGAPATREADVNTAAGRAMSYEDSMAAGRSFTSDLPREELDRARAYAMEELDPAVQEKARKQDMWQALAEMGFRMASSNSPYLLQAIGEAATATLPGVSASKKERKATKENAVRTLMAIEDVDRKTALAGVELGMDIYKTGISQEQFQQQMGFKKEELDLAREKLDAEIAAAEAKGADPEQVILSMFLQGGAAKEVAKDYLGARYPRSIGGGSMTAEDIKKLTEGRGGAAATGPWTQYQQ